MAKFVSYPLAVLATWWDLLSASIGAFLAQFQSIQGYIGVLVLLAVWFFPKWSWAKDIEDRMPRLLALVMVLVWFGWVVMTATHNRIAAEAEAAQAARKEAEAKIAELEKKLPPPSVGVTPIEIGELGVTQSETGRIRLEIKVNVVVDSVNVRRASRGNFFANTRSVLMRVPSAGGTGAITPETPIPSDAIPTDQFWKQQGIVMNQMADRYLSGVEYQPTERWPRGPRTIYTDFDLPDLTPAQKQAFDRKQSAGFFVGRLNYGPGPSDFVGYCAVILSGPRVIKCSE